MTSLTYDALAIFDAAVAGVQPQRLLERMSVEDVIGSAPGAFRRVLVVGAGKASMAMAGAVEAWLGRPVDEGLVVVPHGYRHTLPAPARPPQRIEVVEAGHPKPDAAGVEATRRVLALAQACAQDDLLLVLLSGGGSSLWSAFAAAISLDAARDVFVLLLHSGADIHEINTVRKHLSRIGGGQLAALAAPATVRALVLSDVVGDDLSVIASGPTVPDRSTFDDAIAVLHRYHLWERIPKVVRKHLEAGLRGEVAETPGPDSPLFQTTRTLLIGSNRDALAAAKAEAECRGYMTQILSHALTGEARDVGQQLAAHALSIQTNRPRCLLSGGETTVSITGGGRGGRNQEVALGAALALDGADCNVVVFSGGTDGIDGPTDAAGAWATPQTISQARQHGLDRAAALAENNAYPFFEKLGALHKPGPTHTNVMDVQVALMVP